MIETLFHVEYKICSYGVYGAQLIPKIIIRGLWFSWWGWNLGGGGGERLSATMIE
jgi:hypothetical protein